MPAREYLLRGRVQGVGLRFALRSFVQTLPLVGYAQNQPDGSVVIAAEGTEAALDRLETWLESPDCPAAITERLCKERPSLPRNFTTFSVT